LVESQLFERGARNECKYKYTTSRLIFADFSIKKSFQIHFEALTKASANLYYPTGIKMKNDYCKMVRTQLTQQMGRMNGLVLPTCPLKGIYMFNYSLPTIPLDPAFVSSGDHRWDYVFRLPNEKYLFKIVDYVYSNGGLSRKF
jgi:hypothetical protein